MAEREPERSCVGCRRRAPKGSLLRIVRAPDGSVAVDPTGAADGRGAYVHPTDPCVRAALRPGALARALRAGLGSTELARLRTDMGGVADR